MTDRVEYALPLGPLGGVAHRLFVARTLARIFDHRRTVISELFPPVRAEVPSGTPLEANGGNGASRANGIARS
jgi:hypothetical protein